MERNDQILIAVIIFLWGLFELVALKLAGATSIEVAAWMQAIGTIGAICASLFIFHRERKKREEENFARAASLALSLMGSVWLMEIDLTRAVRHVTSREAAAPNASEWDNYFENARLPVSESLTAAVPQMHGLPEEVIGKLRAIAMLAVTYNEYIARFKSLPPQQVAANWSVLFKQIEGQLSLLQRTVADVQGRQVKAAGAS